MYRAVKFSLLVLAISIISIQFGSALPQSDSSSGSSSSPPPAAAPRAAPKNCIKHPPNFREVDLPCGGYDGPSCLKVCQALGHTRAYCKKEPFCLCNSGNLYSC